MWAADDPPLCITRCMHPAELTIDNEPYCIDCADTWLDRLVAIELQPSMRELLPSLLKTPPVKLRPAPLEPDQSKLLELRKQWAAYQQQVADSDRCIALVRSGDGRCVRRRAAGERLCDTHWAARYGLLPLATDSAP